MTGYLDRIEEDMAVILLEDGERQVLWPADLLDESIHEGDYINIDISYDAEKTQAALQEAMELMQD